MSSNVVRDAALMLAAPHAALHTGMVSHMINAMLMVINVALTSSHANPVVIATVGKMYAVVMDILAVVLVQFVASAAANRIVSAANVGHMKQHHAAVQRSTLSVAMMVNIAAAGTTQSASQVHVTRAKRIS